MDPETPGWAAQLTVTPACEERVKIRRRPATPKVSLEGQPPPSLSLLKVHPAPQRAFRGSSHSLRTTLTGGSENQDGSPWKAAMTRKSLPPAAI